jgi:hypothetical protein
VAIAARKQPTAGAQARSSQNRLWFDHTAPLTTINAMTGTVAASRPTANSTAGAGVNLTGALFIIGTWDHSRLMVTTMAATRPVIARALTRWRSSSNGSRT